MRNFGRSGAPPAASLLGVQRGAASPVSLPRLLFTLPDAAAIELPAAPGLQLEQQAGARLLPASLPPWRIAALRVPKRLGKQCTEGRAIQRRSLQPLRRPPPARRPPAAAAACGPGLREQWFAIRQAKVNESSSSSSGCLHLARLCRKPPPRQAASQLVGGQRRPLPDDPAFGMPAALHLGSTQAAI